MSVAVQCPGCDDIFHVHGFERHHTCRKCGRNFNPQTHPVIERERAEVDK